VIIIRIISLPLAINSFSFSGNPTSGTYRSITPIIVNVNTAALVTFYAANKRIPNCIKVSTTGTSPNIIAQCNWRPSVHGIVAISAIATPVGLGSSVSTGAMRLPIIVRGGNR
jgi:hypothetical protein